MRKSYTIIISSIILILAVVFFYNQGKVENNEIEQDTKQTQINEAEIETDSGSNSEAENEEEEKEENPIANEIKNTVRYVIDGAISVFVKDDIKIVAIGDSLTQGVGDTTENGGYVGVLNNTFEEHNVTISIENYGKRGNRSDQLLKRLEEEEISASVTNSDVVLITVGANDIMKVVKNNFTDLRYTLFQEELVHYEERLEAIINKILTLNQDTEIYYIGFYNPFKQYFSDIEQLDMIVDDWNAAGKKVSDRYKGVYFIPTKDLFQNPETPLLSDDNFHPNIEGYRHIAKRVLDYIKPSIQLDNIDELDEKVNETNE